MRVFATDLDGCLVNVEADICKRIEKHFNVQPDSSRSNEFYMHNKYPDVSEHDMDQFLQSQKCFGDPTLWLAGQPIVENIEEMTKWCLAGLVPSVVTARWTDSRLATEVWLSQHNVPYSNLLFGAKNKKHTLLKHIDAEWMIEDRVVEAKTIAESGTKCYVYQTKHNKTEREDSEIWAKENDLQDIFVWVENYSQITKRELPRL